MDYSYKGYIMKIVVIGATDSVDLIVEYVKNEYKDIDFIPIRHDEIETLDNIIPQIPKDIDGIYATGVGVYNSLHKYKFKFPIVFAKRGGIGLTKTFYNMYLEGLDLKDKTISFDAIDEFYITNIIKEFDIPIKNYYIPKEYQDKSESFHIENHLKLYKDEKIDYIFTSFGYIYSLFKKLNLPVRRIYPSRMDILNSINSLIEEINMANLDKKSLMVYRASVKNNENYGQAKNLFTKFSNSVEGFITENSENSFTIITNKGTATCDLGLNLIVNFIEQRNPIILKSIKIGIATGSTLGQALQNADIALENASFDDNIYFYDGHAMKKIDSRNKDSFIQFSTEEIEKISTRTGIRTKHIQNIYLSTITLNRNIFTSDELADILNLTSRSANRIINSLIRNSYAKEVDNKAFNENVGRPKRYVEINFNI